MGMPRESGYDEALRNACFLSHFYSLSNLLIHFEEGFLLLSGNNSASRQC